MTAVRDDRPIIGVTTDLVTKSSGAAGASPASSGARLVAQLDMDYVHAILGADGIPLLVPPMPLDALESLASILDGLILTGGDGLPASLVGDAGTLPADLSPVAPQRLSAELALYRAVRRAGRPVLGVCLGMQVMSLEAGGALIMDVARELPGAAGHSSKRGRDRHPIHLQSGSAIEGWWNASATSAKPAVNSSHLQAVHSPGQGLIAVAWSDDGVVEAIEPKLGLDEDWRLGVQWHPEREPGALGLDLVRRLVEASRTRPKQVRRSQVR